MSHSFSLVVTECRVVTERPAVPEAIGQSPDETVGVAESQVDALSG